MEEAWPLEGVRRGHLHIWLHLVFQGGHGQQGWLDHHLTWYALAAGRPRVRDGMLGRSPNHTFPYHGRGFHTQNVEEAWHVNPWEGIPGRQGQAINYHWQRSETFHQLAWSPKHQHVKPYLESSLECVQSQLLHLSTEVTWKHVEAHAKLH